ncbi:MAG: DsbA family protein [Pseudomonadota bacterium]
MTHEITRRSALALTAGALAMPALAQQSFADPRLNDMAMGSEDAPVTVIEYASLTCPHCATFHKATWPQFKENYIKTGKVRFIMREVYFDYPGLFASIVARCAGEKAFFPLVDQYLATQDVWARAPQETQLEEIRKVGRINGLTDQAMDSCLNDRSFAEALIANYQTNAQADGVNSTPSFIINGEKVSGAMGYQQFSQIVDRHLA